MDIDEALSLYQVLSPGVCDPVSPEAADWPIDWCAVSSEKDGGIIAYFASEQDANRFRIWMVNRAMNP